MAIVALLGGLGVLFAWFVLGIGDAFLHGWRGSALNTAVLGLGALVAGTRAAVRPQERLSWALVSAGLLLWALGGLCWVLFLEGQADPPFPSIADAFWLAFYVPVYAAIALLARRRVHGLDPRAWIDGLIAALAVSALTSAFALQSVAGALGGDTMAVGVNLAYPIADTLLLAIVVGVVVSARGALDRGWYFLGAGLFVFAATDSVYLVQVARNTYEFGTPLDFGWVAGIAAMGLAAWQPTRSAARRAERDHGIAIPVALALLSLALLVVDHFMRAPLYALALATGSMVLVLVRLVMSHADSRVNLRLTRRQARTDSLTGLGNRLRLVQDLDAICDPEHGEEPHVLLLFDLDGFKHYNDSYGHPAGDALLRRLGQRLAAAVEPEGRAYRMGGDEFCVLIAHGADQELDLLVERARAALTEGGDGFQVGASCGHVLLRSEAADGSEALRIADRRLYADKNSGRLSARVQSMRVLSGAMREWDADLGEHAHDVGALASDVARRLGLEDEDVERVVVAAELHDVGKIAIPRSILQKPGKLNEDEWAFMRRHTLIGERIVQSAPSLASSGSLIRASHERWDGRGYPDGLAADDIPLGAQIVFVCDAFSAMTTDRAYQRAMSEEQALAEIRRGAGTQFSPRAAAALCEIVETRRGTLAVVAA